MFKLTPELPSCRFEVAAERLKPLKKNSLRVKKNFFALPSSLENCVIHRVYVELVQKNIPWRASSGRTSYFVS
jgi:hypothetical protein